MELWKSVDLSPKVLEELVNNKDVLKKSFEDREDGVELFFSRFPFEKLVITPTDSHRLSLVMEFLDQLSDYTEFYSYEDPVNFTVDFILINLSQVSRDCSEIWRLFELLTKILQSNKKVTDAPIKSSLDLERILEVMLKVSTFKSEYENILICYGPILDNLLGFSFPDPVNCLVSDLFEKLKNHNVLAAMIIICRHILNRSKVNCDSFKNVFLWLTQKCPLIMVESFRCDRKELLESTLHCLSDFIINYDNLDTMKKYKTLQLQEYASYLYKNLNVNTSDVCSLSCNEELRPSCFILLEFLLMNFFAEQKLNYISKFRITKELDLLPVDVEKWPQYDTDIFFCICHITVCYSRIIWNEQDVLNSITRWFSNRRQLLKIYVLKSIYFLYPVLKYHGNSDCEIEVTENNTVGDDMLTFFLKFSKISQLYSYNKEQLKWMMVRGSKSLKTTVLYQWMANFENEEILASAIQNCKSESIILELILDKSLGDTLRSKAASLLRKITNSEFSRRVTLTLPLVADQPKIFHNLILAQPGVPSDSKDSILICILMGAVLPTLTDSEVLKGACIFSSKLLASLKSDPNVITLFCQDTANIRHLIKVAKIVDDITAIEIIRLLKVILFIQKKNRVIFKQTLSEDFKKLMKGSTEKIERSLQLLSHVMSKEHYSLISIENKNFLDIYNRVLDYTNNTTLKELAYDCIALILKRMPSLVKTLNTNIHLEISCSAISRKEKTNNLVKMVEPWLRILQRNTQKVFSPVPEPGLRNFIMKASLNTYKVREFITILDELMRRQHLLLKE